MACTGVWIVWLALVVVQLGFGAYGVIVSKFAKKNRADPLVFILIRDAGCCPVLLLAAFVSEKSIQILSQAAQTHFTREGCNVIYIT